MKKLLYIGLDVHKDSISISVAESGRGGEIRSLGKMSNSLHAVEKLIARLRKNYGQDVRLNFCYEAGPCGFVLVRRLLQLGHDCIVVAPSKLARQSGDRVKTDKRDAEHRALGKAGVDCRRQPGKGETSGSERIKSLPAPTALETLPPSTSRKPPMRPSATFAAHARMPSMTCAGRVSASRPSSSSTATTTKARPTGAKPTCVTCVNSSCPTPP